MICAAVALALLVDSSGAPAEAAAPVPTPTPFTVAGSVDSDVRWDFPHGIPKNAALERARSTLAVRAEAQPADRIRAVLDARVQWLGEPATSDSSALTTQSARDPIRVDADALFAEISRGPIRFRAGRQTIRWGSGLLFNPTSVISPPDLEDPLRYASPLGNEMLRAEVKLGPLRLDAIGVPRFRPALLPPVSSRDVLRRSGVPAAITIADDPSWTIDLAAANAFPPANDSGSHGARLSARIPALSLDASVMGYYGFTPVPQLGSADLAVDPVEHTLSGTVTLVYPRTAVAGVDLAAQIPLGRYGSLGAWFEGTWNKAQAWDQIVTINGSPATTRALEDPWTRAAAGVDHTTEGGLYASLQWVRGLPDETGADATRDYALLIAERPFARERFKARMVGAIALKDGSALAGPEVSASFDALTFSLGAYGGHGSDTQVLSERRLGPPILRFHALLAF